MSNYGILNCIPKLKETKLLSTLLHRLYQSQRVYSDQLKSQILSYFEDSVQEKVKGRIEELMDVLSDLIELTVYQTYVKEDELAKVIFPSSYKNDNVKMLLVEKLVQMREMWRSEEFDRMLSLPKLEQLKYRVDIKYATEKLHASKEGIAHDATMLLQLDIRENPDRIDEIGNLTTVNYELNRETIDVVLKGMYKIRDQLKNF